MAAIRAENDKAMITHVARQQSDSPGPKAGEAVVLERAVAASLAEAVEQPASALERQLEREHAATGPAAEERRARWNRLRREVPLTEVAIPTLLALEPLTLAELQAMGRGSFATMAVKATQTRDDSEEQATQTERAEPRAAQAQAPEDLGLRREDLEGRRGPGRARRRQARAKETFTRLGALEAGAQRRLTRFVVHAGSIIDHLLTERTEQSAIAFPGAGRAGGLTDGHLALAAPGAFCRGRAAVAQAVSAGVAPQLLVAYSPRGGPGAKVVADHGLSGAGCLLVWDLKAPEAPRHVLLVEGAPACCCWGAPGAGGKDRVALAGMRDGGICLWDLKEDVAGQHAEEEAEHGLAGVRRPTYTTEFNADCRDVAPVVAICLVPRQEARGDRPAGRRRQDLADITGGGGAGRLQFSFVTLDQDCNAKVWSVVEASAVEVASLAAIDAGLRINGRVRLLLARNVPLREMAGSGGLKRNLALAEGRALACFPAEPEQFLVGSTAGRCLKGTVFGNAPSVPKYFAPGDGSGAAVAAIAFSPFTSSVFAVARADGEVAVYRSAKMLPEKTFPGAAEGLRGAQWSPHQPSVLYLLDSASRIHAFDTAEGRSVAQEAFGADAGGVESFRISPAPAFGKARDARFFMSVVLGSGEVQCHRLRPPAEAGARGAAGGEADFFSALNVES